MTALTLCKLDSAVAHTRAVGISDWMALQRALPQLRLLEV